MCPMTTSRDPKLVLIATHSSACTYHFRSIKPLDGWALCTVNDTTGELLITSDWGNWAHLWNPKHLGCPSLTHFITNNDYDYLANKLLGKRAAWVIDADTTIAWWRKALAEKRLQAGRAYVTASDLTASLAREIWEDLGSLHDAASDEALFIERAMHIEGIRWVSECPWDDIAHQYSHAYRVLVDFILPALAAACRETIQRPDKRSDQDGVEKAP